jgi:hypothetical protein
LKDALKPYELNSVNLAWWMQWWSADNTMSGAKGSDATMAHGARVPSSGPYGTPRAT